MEVWDTAGAIIITVSFNLEPEIPSPWQVLVGVALRSEEDFHKK
jgi:hypothetical protein